MFFEEKSIFLLSRDNQQTSQLVCEHLNMFLMTASYRLRFKFRCYAFARKKTKPISHNKSPNRGAANSNHLIDKRRVQVALNYITSYNSIEQQHKQNKQKQRHHLKELKNKDNITLALCWPLV